MNPQSSLNPQQQAQFQAILQRNNYTPPTPAKTAGWYEKVTAANKPTPPAMPNVAQETGSNYMSNVAPAAQDVMGGGNIGAAVSDLSKGNIGSGLEHASLGVASDAVKAIFAPIAAPIQTLLDHTAKANAANPSITGKEINTPQAQAARQQIADWAKAHPDFARTIGDAFTVGTAALGSGALDSSVSDVASAVKNSVVKGANTVKTAALGTPEEQAAAQVVKKTAQTTANTAGDLKTISERITPKPTVAEAKKAMSEGRLFKGQESTFKSPLTPGTPDKVALTPQQGESAFTIHKLIPGAAKMDEPTLYSALDEKIGETAKQLTPQMKATPIKPATIKQITDEWTNLKKTQLTEAKATDEPNVLKWQQNFEKYLTKSGSENMDDLWKSAKEYDASIKANVKNASDLSPEDLQVQKDIWLQNRAILRSAITDTANGMGKTGAQAFKDMHNMYEGQNGLLTKAEIAKTGVPSKVDQVISKIKEHKILTGIAAYETLKHTVAPILP